LITPSSKVFGKRYRSKKVDLTCPYCGHLQQEPSLVISSFCQSCGEHFRVRKGVAIANPGLRVSGIAEVRPLRKRNPLLATPEPTGAPAPAGNSWLVSAEAQEAGALPLPEPAPRSAGDETELTAGAFFGLGAPNVPSDAVETTGPSLGRNAQSREALAEGSLGALIAAQQTVVVAEKDKMPPNYAAPDDRRRRDDNVPGIRVRCFRCHHHQDVSRFAKSTQCERCSAYISLANYEIKTVKSHTLRTRGDIIIAKKGGLIHNSEIACHHLTVSGSIDATVDCTGDAVFRHSGTVRGQLHCEKLVIEKHCEVRFPDGVMANRAEIAGHLIGDLTCSGKVRIARTGIVEGDLVAIDLELRDGGRVSGGTRLDPGITTELALRKGFNPTVIG
jgi:cytoskeletal protein CcmA (bactofilin family)/ribosomal protein S27E